MNTELSHAPTLTHPIGNFVLAAAPRGLDPDDLSDSNPAWVTAAVPGGVHEALLAAGTIADPYFDTNEDGVRWMEDQDWWYRTDFPKPSDLATGERLRLVFHGLDTVVTIWLNGLVLGEHENMFRPAEYDVTDLLNENNELLLRFSPPLAGLTVPESVAETNRRIGSLFSGILTDDPDGTNAPAEEAAAEAETMSPMLPLTTLRRKATFSWGWDFGPRIPSIGIWRPVELVRGVPATITGHHVTTTALNDGAATVALLVQTNQPVDGLAARVQLTSPSGAVTVVELPFAGDSARGVITVNNPELWWTHDLGTPHLYDVVIDTLLDGHVQSTVTDRIGLRTITINRADDPEGGRFFQFILNGVPLFARGAAWLPASMLVGSVTPERHRHLLRLAQQGNMNMIRIWGGGIYEHDSFYEATDELGLLIWHDFMFACTDYPSRNQTLQAEVQAEATYQVRRLRNRASMGLWSGNNEVQLIHGFAHQNYEPGDWGYDFFNEILPDTVAREDGSVPYWPGSPYGENTTEGFMAVNGVLDGDRHAWEVWHGFDFGAGGGPYDSIGASRHYRRYANDTGKFISEFGIHASPELATLTRWIPEENLAIHSPSFDAHNKDHPKNKHDAVLEIITGLPTTMEEYVDFTMVSQAEGLKFGIEHYRRRQPHCSGTLIWQLNDVWPGFSWSVIDYDLVPKAGYFYARRTFAPVLASFKPTPDGVELWVSNSTTQPVDTEATVSWVTLDGQTTSSITVKVALEPGASEPFWSGNLGTTESLWVDSSTGVFAVNRFFASEIKDLQFSDHSITHTVTTTGPTSARVEVSSSGYNYLTRVTTPFHGVEISDNYFDLRDGETRTVTVTGLPEGFDPADLNAHPYVG